MSIHDIYRAERTEMYLKAVYTIALTDPPVTNAKVAEYMCVAAPSSHEKLRRLEAQGLLASGATDGYRLTPEGLATAVKVVRRLRLAERLLTDILRMEIAHAHSEACKLEHVISREVESRLWEVLGHPATCPHGLPIPGDRPISVELLPTLDQIGVGARAEVASIPERDEEVVALLAGIGLLPGTSVSVREVAPLGGPITVRTGGQGRALSREVARRLRVRPRG